MDNLTHALAGLLAAECASALYARKHGAAPSWRTAACLTSILANNMPDSDLVLSGLTGGRLGYLLHHRGHTHTLAMVVPMALLALAPAWLWMRARARSIDWRPVIALALLGGVMHLAMDGTNEYGVHPLWPLDDRWFYGDTIFIVEPLLWASAIPALWWGLATRWAKALLLIQLLAIVIAAWTLGSYVRPTTAAILTAYAIAIAVGARLAPAMLRPWIGALAWAGVTATFAFGSSRAEAIARAAHAALEPGAVIDDVVLSPTPADPSCWRLIVVSHDDQRFLARTGRISTSDRLAVSDCPHLEAERTATVAPIVAPDTDAVDWGVGLTLPRAELTALAKRCDVAAFLRFARVPFWMTSPKGVQVGDLRYDREAGLGFTELLFPPEPADCPRRVPPWVPPREPVLRP